MAVAAVAERAAVEDQEARLGIPAAALDVVAAVGERNVPFTRAVAEQRGVVAGVGVRQRGDGAVGAGAVGEEGLRAGDALVEAGRELDLVAAGVLARADERAQRDRVVVRRGLAVDAVGVEVRGEVAVELGDGEVGGVELGEREAGDQQRVELERAVVAGGGEVGADVLDLVGEAGEQARGVLARRLEALPGVDPVEDAAGGDLGGVLVGGALADPRRGELLPRPLVAGVREVEPPRELDPLDPPLRVLREVGAVPVGIGAERARLARDGEAPARRRRPRSRGSGARARSCTAPGGDGVRRRSSRADRFLEQLGQADGLASARRSAARPSRARCRRACGRAPGPRAAAAACRRAPRGPPARRAAR